MVQQHNTSSSSSRRLRFHQLSVILLSCIATSNICAVTAWTPPADTHSKRHSHQSSSTHNYNISPLFSTIDELYYTPSTQSTPTTNSVFESTQSTSEEMEIAAQNYGCGTMNNGGGGSGGAMQKITLTRWLQAKVQDYPEVC